MNTYREEHAAIHRKVLLKWLYANHILPMGSRMKYATFTCSFSSGEGLHLQGCLTLSTLPDA